MIGLLAPLGLALLAAWVLPLLIHLLRRPENHVVDFAAWRYLSVRALPRERLQLRRWLLLVLRLLLLAVLALLLAQPVWRSREQTTQAWVAVLPGVDAAAAARAMVDAPTAQWHWLAAGYPAFDTSPPPASPVAVSSWLRQLDAELAQGIALTVVVPEQIAGLDAQRLRLSREVRWQIVPGVAAETADASPLHLSVRGGNSGERRTVQALLRAWLASGVAIEADFAEASVALPLQADVLIWLGGEPGPEIMRWVVQGGHLLRGGTSDASPSLVETPFGSGVVITVAGSLSADETPALRAAEVPERLRRTLLHRRAPPDRAYAASVAPAAGADAGIEPGHPLDRVLILLAALLFAAERLCAASLRRA